MIGRVDRIVGIYLFAALLWIVAGGAVGEFVAARTGVPLTTIELVKGSVFVIGTAVGLRISLNRHARRLSDAAGVERQAADRLREVARIRTAFLRGISHELRTPLTNILGYSLTLDAHVRDLDADTIEQFTKRLVANSRKLEALLLDLMDLHRLTADSDPPPLEPVRLDRLVGQVVERLNGQSGSHRLHVRADDAVVRLDVAKTGRILDELIRNALRHTPPGTNVWVRAVADDDVVRLTVEDDGPGVAPEVYEGLFEPFTQGREAEESPSPGLGIGLALVRRYANDQVGRATVTPRPAGGACFEVTIPKRAPR